VAPSANPEGAKPAKTIFEAKRYFGSEVDFYVSGKNDLEPSTLVKLNHNGELTVLRQGAVKIK
jgi:L-threonylcarbamoyladenylate synthase